MMPILPSAFLGALLTAAFLLQWWKLPMYLWWLWASLALIALIGLLSFVGCFGCLSSFDSSDRLRRIAALCAAATLGVAVAFLAVMRVTHTPSARMATTFTDGATITLQGTIVGLPERRGMTAQYVLAVEGGRVLLRDYDLYPRLAPGDRVRASGTIRRFIEGDDDRDTGYARYLAAQDVYAVLDRAHIRNIGPPQRFLLQRVLANARGGFIAAINRIQPEPHASILAGLLVGARGGITSDIRATLQRTGLTHILAISGYNVTIVATGIGVALAWLPRRLRFACIAVILALFCLVTGASASVVRATIMGILGLFTLSAGRQRSAALAILWTASLMTLWNPRALWWDAGFQLSFLAVAGLAALSPLLTPRMKCIPDILGIRETTQMTIAASAFAVPWAAFAFGTLPIVAPLANILVLPLVPLAMYLGFASVLIGFLWFPLGQVVGYLAWGVITLILGVAEGLAALPFSAIATPWLPVGLLGAYYALLIAAITRAYQR